MKRLIQYLAILIISVFFVNCSASFFSLTPDENSSLEMGRKVITKENDLAYSTISFEDQEGDHFIFHVFVYNKEQNDFIFDPSEVYVKYYDENKQILDGNRHYALDPEEQIHNIEDDIKKRDDTHATLTGLNIVFSLFDTIADLADDDDNDAEEVLENVVIFGGNQISEEIDYENDIEYLKANRSFWKNEVLRKTELSNGEGIDGIIYLPLHEEAKYVKIYLSIGETIHAYKFKQVELD